MTNCTKGDDLLLKFFKRCEKIHNFMRPDKNNNLLKEISFEDFLSETSDKAASSMAKFGAHGILTGGLIGFYKCLGASLTFGEHFSNVMVSARNGGTRSSLVGGSYVYMKSFYCFVKENERRAENFHNSVKNHTLKKSIRLPLMTPLDSKNQTVVSPDPDPYPYL